MKKQILFIICFLFFLNVFSQEKERTNDVNRHFDAAMFPKGITTINVYSSKECGRCGNVVELLRKDSIVFNEFDLTDPKVFDEMNAKVYKAVPYKDLTVTTEYPVFEIDSIIFHHIEDHVKFANDLIEYLHGKKEDKVNPE
ncbi:MAG TPA: hypothetical protein PLI16_00915 [Bacteroidales bacterium]|jgi:glutaredoxin|nr:hypothetical protein [Bacteroidales bacterium]HNZ43234.1 hypothetical protein [Bacteroidales bacterium]HOH83150.1 hypothetical protein [Bacteroidales bacterium]HPB25946.1 hypothetical protein [Bacteroidales bacterium]HPI30766.1 hypothetical protein [Bacteroidales bacterium]